MIPFLHEIPFRFIRRLRGNPRDLEKIKSKILIRKFLSNKEGNELIKKYLREETSFIAGKMGTTELKALLIYHGVKNFNPRSEEEKWAPMKKRDGRYGGGIYPDTPEVFNTFVSEYQKVLKEVDILGLWYNPHESLMAKKFSKKATFIDGIRSLEPFYFNAPWSAELEGKKVLVITGFPKTVEYQYKKNRKKLWPQGANMLPDFELKTLGVPQNAGVVTPPYENWPVALEDLKKKLNKIEFDVAIIGAGGWSLPLAKEAKAMGKSAIHAGGGLQLIFGIKGGRWDRIKAFRERFYNDHWIRLLKEEKPPVDKISQIPKGDQYW